MKKGKTKEYPDIKIGTKDHPIKLLLQGDGMKKDINYFDRPLLHLLTKNRLYSNAVLEAEDRFDFNKLHNTQDEYLTFMHNLISNPHLKPMQLKVGLALYSLLCWTKWGEMYITTTKKLNIENIGYLGEVTIRKGKRNKKFILDENSRLINILSNDFNISVNNQDLNLTLKVLHQFSYITITDISPKNLFSDSKKLWSKQYPEKHIDKTKFRTYIKHIRLNFSMENKSLVRRWLSKEELGLIKKANN